jgi:hypothetical protein
VRCLAARTSSSAFPLLLLTPGLSCPAGGSIPSSTHPLPPPSVWPRPGIDPSVRSVGDAYDALAESVIELFKTELIKPRGPWRTVEQLEIATLEYVD